MAGDLLVLAAQKNIREHPLQTEDVQLGEQVARKLGVFEWEDLVRCAGHSICVIGSKETERQAKRERIHVRIVKRVNILN